MPSRSLLATACALAAVILLPASAAAAPLDDPVNQWLPSSEGAQWDYEWFNSGYSPRRTRERYTVKAREGASFRLAWTTEGLGNGEGTAPGAGEIDYRRTDLGLVNTNWASTPPPSQFPVLCASATQCPNSLSAAHFMLIWGTRSPVLLEPLVQKARWSSLGGANSDVSSASRYLGRQRVAVRSFPAGVTAAVVESEVTQAGALGDPFGSGVRTVWWVHGVGPVKIRFRHAGGETSEAELVETNLRPLAAPSDLDPLPLNKGDKMRLRWRNSRHMRRASVQELTVGDVVNSTARVDVKHVSGPIRVRGAYTFAKRLSGVTNLNAQTEYATRAKLPPLGPRSQPADRRRRFATPLDLMVFGFNPVVSANPVAGQFWKSRRGSRDHRTFGVTGTTRVLGIRRIRTPVGRLRTLVVESTLTQSGFRFGSGRRTMYFAPGRGLVKLVFRHRDGSVSTVDRVR